LSLSISHSPMKTQAAASKSEIAGNKRNAGAAKVLFQKLGPGLITGASDDDPSGIATYSQVGAQFGYGLLWTMVLTYPLMTAIQEISARIGRVTGIGIAANLRKNYPKPVLYCVLIMVSVATSSIWARTLAPWRLRRIWSCRERSVCSL
jgi:Mn2+/Fe2+ NRAMP family transporter